MENLNTLKKLNITTIIIFFLSIIILFITDWYRFFNSYPNIIPNYWFIDIDLTFPLSVKGSLMFTSIILTIIAMIGYGILLGKLIKIREEKEEKYYSTLMIYIISYFLMARIVEFLYIPSDSDFFGINYVGQFHIAFDIVAGSLYIIFTFQIFMAVEIHQNSKLISFVLIILFSWFSAALVGILSYVITSNTTLIITILVVVTSLDLFIVGILSGIIVYKIIILRQKIKERRKEVLFIALQLITIFFMWVCIILTIYFYFVVDNAVVSYIFRILKLILNFINIGLSWVSIIHPSSKK